MLPGRVGPFFIYGGTIADFLEEGHFPMKRDKLTILVITGDRISTFVLNNCVGSGSSTHDAVGQHVCWLCIFHQLLQESIRAALV